MKRNAVFLAITLSAVSLLALVPSKAEPSSAGDFKIAVLTELSGPGAAIGQECRRGAELALHSPLPGGVLADRQVSILYGDSQDDARVAVNEFNKFVSVDNVQVVLVSRSKIGMPLNPLSRQRGVPLVGTVAHPKFISGNPYSVRVYVSAGVEGAFLAEKAFAEAKRRVAIITVEDEWNLSFSKAFADRFTELGGRVVYNESLVLSDMNFSTEITAIKRSKPDAVFANLQLSQSGVFVKKLREQGVSVQLLSNYWIQKPEIVDVAGSAALESTLFGEVDSERPKFMQHFKSRFGDEVVTPGTYVCYVGVGTILDALRKSSKKESSDFRTVLTSLTEVELLDDVIPFRGREIQYQLKAKRIRNGKKIDAR